ncbi:MAG: lipoyl synthase [Zoogloeaceae bacterium]|jgi:lipoic acid synthetase|nr:lipoyl synthase [Zoogloeaceae bacterium]
MRERGVKQKGEQKTARVIPLVSQAGPHLKKPDWIRVKAGDATGNFGAVRKLLRAGQLHTVCEEAACPNMSECFGRGVATFMILGDICTRRCPFCDVGHGLPLPPDADEPARIARCVAQLKLNYVVITSVDRDDLKDGGAAHFAAVVAALRTENPGIQVELLTPDFRGRLEIALEQLGSALPDVLNHNLETVPRLYRAVRPGADYAHSLKLLRDFKTRYPQTPTKSGLMAGLGETDAEILAVLQDLRAHGVERLTIGQYLAPSRHHLPVQRYVAPETFRMYAAEAARLGFTAAACAPMVRSSYRADQGSEKTLAPTA